MKNEKDFSGISYGIIFENLEPLAGRKLEPETTIQPPSFGIPIFGTR